MRAASPVRRFWVPRRADVFNFAPISVQNSVHRPVIVPDPQVDEPDDDSGDEVYDVYYRDLRKPALETGAGATDVGTLAGLKRIGALYVLLLWAFFLPLLDPDRRVFPSPAPVSWKKTSSPPNCRPKTRTRQTRTATVRPLFPS